MSSFNQVILVGNLGKDPEIVAFQNGDRIANFSIATSESWTDKASGEKRERTEWHRIVIQGDGLVRVVDNYLRKGGKVMVRGKLQTRKWQGSDGVERYATEIVVRDPQSLVLLGGKGDSGGAGAARNMGAENTPASPAQRSAAHDYMDDDVPF